MLSKRIAFDCIVACILGSVAIAPAIAADLTISPVPRHIAARPADAKRLPAKAATGVRKDELAHANKAKRLGKDVRRQILTYSLYRDPLFKPDGTIRGMSRLLSIADIHPVAKSASITAPSALKLDEAEHTGIAFGCLDKPFQSRALSRELTACYRHSVDKSWKTQTYVSREAVEGGQKWGGGLAVQYVY